MRGPEQTNDLKMNEIKIFVRGMNCNHCKMTVESQLKKLEGIDDSIADVDNEMVILTGDHIDLDKVKEAVESVGYKYDGKVA